MKKVSMAKLARKLVEDELRKQSVCARLAKKIVKQVGARKHRSSRRKGR
jgi:hypothetical protein